MGREGREGELCSCKFSLKHTLASVIFGTAVDEGHTDIMLLYLRLYCLYTQIDIQRNVNIPCVKCAQDTRNELFYVPVDVIYCHQIRIVEYLL